MDGAAAAAPPRAALYQPRREREREEGTRELCLIFGRRESAEESINKVNLAVTHPVTHPPPNRPLPPLLPIYYFPVILLLSSEPINQDARMPPDRTRCLSISERERERSSFGAMPRKTSDLFVATTEF